MCRQCQHSVSFDCLLRLNTTRQTDIFSRQHHYKQQQQQGMHRATSALHDHHAPMDNLTTATTTATDFFAELVSNSLRQTVSMQASNIRIGANLHSAHACYVYCTLCLISYALFCLQINTFTLLANSCPGGGGGGGRIVSRWSISARNDANSFHLSPFALFILSLLCWHRSAHSNAQAHTQTLWEWHSKITYTLLEKQKWAHFQFT